MMILLKLIWGKVWKQLMIAAVIGAAIWYVSHLQTTVKNQAETIKNQLAAIDIYEENDKKMMNSLNAVTKSFEQIDLISQQNAKNFEVLKTLVSTNGGKLSAKLDQMSRDKKPQTCEETIQYLIDARKELK